MASDMMEALFLDDPGYFLTLDDGVKYFLWRRTMLKSQNKSIRTDRLYPGFPIFKFDFKNTFTKIDPRTGAPYIITETTERATYAYFYACWRRKAFPSDQEQGSAQEPADSTQHSTTADPHLSFNTFLTRAKFWDTFGPDVAENSMEGRRKQNAIHRNILVHLDLVSQGFGDRTGKDFKYKHRDEVFSSIEDSSSNWGNPEWQHPEDYIPTSRELMHLVLNVYPYAISIDPHVKERECQIKRTRSTHADIRPVLKNSMELHPKTQRPVTEEEAKIMEQFCNFGEGLDKGVEEAEVKEEK